jgi:hypothetical protein
MSVLFTAVHAEEGVAPAPPAPSLPEQVRHNQRLNPECRLYWCLMEFIGWRYSQ